MPMSSILMQILFPSQSTGIISTISVTPLLWNILVIVVLWSVFPVTVQLRIPILISNLFTQWFSRGWPWVAMPKIELGFPDKLIVKIRMAGSSTSEVHHELSGVLRRPNLASFPGEKDAGARKESGILLASDTPIVGGQTPDTCSTIIKKIINY